MGRDPDARPEEVRSQVAAIFRGAGEIIGSRMRLADHLGVPPEALADWINMISDAPDEAVRAALEIILESRRP